MRVYAILVSQGNDLFYLSGKAVIQTIKKHHGMVAQRGYDQTKYLTCLVFPKMLDRNRCAEEFRKLNIKFDTRDDGNIDDLK